MVGNALTHDLMGWFHVGWSSEVGVGDVVTMHYFGEELVAFRARDGDLHVLDAYCQHIGAHLGYGGCVTDAGIRCPFHGWVWDADGRNVEIPDHETPNRARRIRAWQSVERNGLIYIWTDPSGGTPRWEVPDALHDLTDIILGRTFHPIATKRYPGLRVHPQYVIENAVDPAHFRFVHGTPTVPAVLHEFVDDWTWYAEVGFGNGWKEGQRVADRPMASSLTLKFSGIGLGYNALLNSGVATLILIATTPVDDQTTEILQTVWLEHAPGDDQPGAVERRANAMMEALPQDVTIWNNQRYLDPAGLVADEVRGFNRMRRWTKRFYTGADRAEV